MASSSEKEHQNIPAQNSVEIVSVELAAPQGWKKKVLPCL